MTGMRHASGVPGVGSMLRLSLLLLMYAGSMLLSLLPGPIKLGPSVNLILSAQLYGFSVAFAVLAVERAGLPRKGGDWWYAFAVIAGIGVGTALYWYLSQRLIGIPTDHVGEQGFENYASFALRHGPLALTACGLGTAVYVARSRATQRLDALRDLQSMRAHSEQEFAEAKFAALQARIDPDYVLGELERIELEYDLDPPVADRLLDRLVLYLRAAIPVSSAVR